MLFTECYNLYSSQKFEEASFRVPWFLLYKKMNSMWEYRPSWLWFLLIFSSYLFVSLENVVFAERTCCVHLEPFHNACCMEMMVAREGMEFCSIFIWAKTDTAFLKGKMNIKRKILKPNSTALVRSLKMILITKENCS